jgi:hypothetical protein
MITPQQVTALLAQLATSVDVYPAYDTNGNLLEGWQLNFNAVPVYIGSELGVRGVGIYGQSVDSLILTGYVKSAAANLIVDDSLVTTVLSSPAVWTGLNGINSLLDYLSSEDLQNQAQIDLMIGAYQGLVDAGIFTGNQTARFEATFLQPASRYGVDIVIAWINGEVDANTANTLTTSARQGQYAIDFMASNITAINTVPTIVGATNTTIRTAVDQAVTDIIGNDKVPVIDFGGAVANVANVSIPATTNEDGVFRFAPGKPAA